MLQDFGSCYYRLGGSIWNKHKLELQRCEFWQARTLWLECSRWPNSRRKSQGTGRAPACQCENKLKGEAGRGLRRVERHVTSSEMSLRSSWFCWSLYKENEHTIYPCCHILFSGVSPKGMPEGIQVGWPTEAEANLWNTTSVADNITGFDSFVHCAWRYVKGWQPRKAVS